MSQGSEFQVVLTSNVAGSTSNTPGAFETNLAYPLDCSGNWEVALIDITYPHTWLDMDKEVVVGISCKYDDNEQEENVNIIGETNSWDLVRALRYVGSYYSSLHISTSYRRGRKIETGRRTIADFKVKKTFSFIPNKYKLKDICEKLQTEIRSIDNRLANTRVFYDHASDRVTISGNARKIMISSYSSNSLLPMLGFANQVVTNLQEMQNRLDCWEEGTDVRCVPLSAEAQTYLDGPDFTLIDYIVIEPTRNFEAGLPPRMGRLNEIFVYTDIIVPVLVGNSQVPVMGYFPVQSKWGDQAYWNFNPPYYVRVKDSDVRTIAIRLCDKTGETIRFESGDVICRLNFRRVGLMRGFM